LYTRSQTIIEKGLGPEHPSFATSLNNLAALYRDEGKYEEAESLYQRSLAIREKALGPEHPDLAGGLNNLADLYELEGKYQEAEPLYKRALTIQEKALGTDNPAFALSIANLAGLYGVEGRYAEAEPLYLRSLAIREKALGPLHPDVATSLNNLASFYRTKGLYGEAEPLFERARSIYQTAYGPTHPQVAAAMNNLADLYEVEGKYPAAEDLFKRSLKIRESRLGPQHPQVGLSMNNLANLYELEGKYGDAQPLIKAALEIQEKSLGPEHPEVAKSLNNLAAAYKAEGKYAEAEPLLLRSIAIDEKAFGTEHPDVAVGLVNLSSLHFAQGNYTKAEAPLQRALLIQEKALGSGHPSLGITTGDMAALYAAEGTPERAAPFYDRSLDIYAKQFDYLFPYMSETERLSFLDSVRNIFPAYYSFCYRYAKANPEFIGRMYDVLLWQKGFVGRSVSATRAKIAASNDKASIALLDNLTSKRSRLASLLLSHPTDQAEWKKSVDQLTLETSELEKQLLQVSRQFAVEKKLERLTWRDVQAALKPGEAAIEFITFAFNDGKRWTGETFYVALIVTPQTKIAPKLVQLGKEKELEDMSLLKYRDLVSENPVSARSDGSVYQTLWQPIENVLQGAKKIFLSPEGVLTLVSFPVIPMGDGRRLGDKYDIRVVSSTKDLLRDASNAGTKYAVLIGDPRFDLTEPEQRAATQKKSKGINDPGSSLVLVEARGLRSQELREGVKLAPLPATKVEIATIAALLRKHDWQLEEYTEDNATKESIQQVKGPKILHVATHAFFLPDQAASVRGTLLQMPPGFEDPMLRSGLFFAGANRALRGEKPSKDLEDGILTAYEAAGLNLQGTELVVLSACDTGLGKIENGEGVFGLRRAFQEAGAQAVLMSLWAVPDRETQELMTLFYTRWLGGEDKQQALRDAQMELRLKVRARYGDDKPFYWGGFVLVGR
jgi:CHAT domain-containing protein/Tfp pilus assembly protein PilF